MVMTTQLRDAMNAHDLGAFLNCFHVDYQSEQPVHPGRGFGGRDQVRANWSAIFDGVSDFSADRLGYCDDAGRAWSEWRWSRLSVEPVQATDGIIDEAVRQMAGTSRHEPTE